MAQFAFILTYGPEAPSDPTTIPIRCTVRFVDTDQNLLDQRDVSFTVSTGSNAAQIVAAGIAAVKTFGASHGYPGLGANSVISPDLARG